MPNCTDHNHRFSILVLLKPFHSALIGTAPSGDFYSSFVRSKEEIHIDFRYCRIMSNYVGSKTNIVVNLKFIIQSDNMERES
jgi:hypothetical protein